MKTDRSLNARDDIRAYIEDRHNVLDDPDRFGVAVIVTFLHESNLTIAEILVKQRKLDMSLSKKEIEKILSDLVTKGYVSRTAGAGYGPTSRLFAALERDGLSEERLIKLANVLTR